MTKTFCILSLLILITACDSGVNLYLDNEKTALYRNFGRITDAEQTGQTYFNVVKRHRQVMAEKVLWHGEKTQLQFLGGRHKDKDWNGGLVMRYEF